MCVLCCGVPFLRCGVLCCAVLCCAVLCCAAPCVLCCAVLCCAVPCPAVPCRAMLCCAVPTTPFPAEPYHSGRLTQVPLTTFSPINLQQQRPYPQRPHAGPQPTMTPPPHPTPPSPPTPAILNPPLPPLCSTTCNSAHIKDAKAGTITAKPPHASP